MNTNDLHEDFTFSSTDGLLLHAVKSGWRNKDPHPVVCLPSLTGNAREFSKLAEFLVSEAGGNRRVLAISARGRGMSEKDRNPANYNIMTEAADVLTGITAAGLQDVNVIGTARGGLTALLITGQRPGILKSVILNEAAPKIEGQELVRQRQLLIHQKKVVSLESARTFLKNYREPFFPALSDDDWMNEAEIYFKSEKKKYVPNYDKAVLTGLNNMNMDVRLGEMWNEFSGLKNIASMVIRGQRSDMITDATIDRMLSIKPDLKIVSVEGQGHSPLLHTGELPAIISRFLQ